MSLVEIGGPLCALQTACLAVLESQHSQKRKLNAWSFNVGTGLGFDHFAETSSFSKDVEELLIKSYLFVVEAQQNLPRVSSMTLQKFFFRAFFKTSNEWSTNRNWQRWGNRDSVRQRKLSSLGVLYDIGVDRGLYISLHVVTVGQKLKGMNHSLMVISPSRHSGAHLEDAGAASGTFKVCTMDFGSLVLSLVPVTIFWHEYFSLVSFGSLIQSTEILVAWGWHTGVEEVETTELVCEIKAGLRLCSSVDEFIWQRSP